MSELTCCYCGKETSLQGQRPHQERCLHGPAGQRAKAWMIVHAVNGVAMQQREYRDNDERRALKLPAEEAIYQAFGTWQDFVEWCGLTYIRQRRKPSQDWRHKSEGVILNEIDADIARNRAAERDAFDWSAMPVSKHSVKPVYNWRTYRYELCEVMELR